MSAELVRVSRGVWRPATAVAELAGQVAAMLSAFPPGTVVAGWTAAALHGLWLPNLTVDRIEVIVRPEVPVPRDRAYSRRPEVRARRQILLPDEITVVGGILLTTEARTWVDLAAALRLPDLVAAGDSVLRGGSTIDDVVRLLDRARHRPGVVRARQALPHLDGRSRSRPESHMRFALVSAGLPKPAVNQPVFDEHGQWLLEPDLGYDDVKLGLEYNGALHAEVDRMRRDITREVDAGMRGGWRTETFGPAEVFGHPDQLATYVRELRRERLRLFR